jgi:hypothetical protein
MASKISQIEASAVAGNTDAGPLAGARHSEVLAQACKVSEELYRRLEDRFTRDEMVELCFLVGLAALVNRVHATFGTDVDAVTRASVGDAPFCPNCIKDPRDEKVAELKLVQKLEWRRIDELTSGGDGAEAKRQHHEMLAGIGRDVASCRLGREAEAPVIIRVAQHEDCVPEIVARSLESFPYESRAYALPLKIGMDRDRRESKRSHGRIKFAEKDMTQDPIAFGRNKRDNRVARLSKTVHELRFG